MRKAGLPVKLILIGHGKMGRGLEQTAQKQGDEILAVLDSKNLHQLASLPKADMLIDFSHPQTLPILTDYIRRTQTPFLCGTTGYSEGEMDENRALGDLVPVLYSANFSLGVMAALRVLPEIVALLEESFDMEIVECHHNQKPDAPSGTAKLLLSAIDPAGKYTPVYGRQGEVGKRTKKEIGIHAIRGGTVAAMNEVRFFGFDEELTIAHRATSDQVFVNGALYAAKLLAKKPKGVYALLDLLFGE
jgi:4-hydroxy-tetrahydrodipicolinate reductase